MRFAALLGLLVVSTSWAAERKSRTFQFVYGVTVTGQTPSEEVSLWLPVPPKSPEQEILDTKVDLPGEPKLTTEKKHGNSMYFLKTKADKEGNVTGKITYTIKRKEVVGDSGALAEFEKDLYLKPDEFVPSEGKYLKLLEKAMFPDDPVKQGRLLYDIVNKEMKYSKEGTGWGKGDVNWACDSKYGNCTDFHSLFIGFARTRKFPAKFEIGFSIPEKKGTGDVAGYHCWAKFSPDGKKWIPVDISEASKNPKMTDYYFGNLTEDRVTFSSGRDLVLEPKQAGPALNFFIYPYAEVDGKPIAPEKIQRKFAYTDVEKK